MISVFSKIIESFFEGINVVFEGLFYVTEKDQKLNWTRLTVVVICLLEL